ncbi:recombinase family protein [Helicobacter sp. NHP22-001]|uniref:recombinase family protein n=1 Tax=Helicobacter sp. NHP22-001 TaxID=3040202 RepID=UPI00255326D5|nr:recombinase family protein [Helicobacter sp. NHP22-001]
MPRKPKTDSTNSQDGTPNKETRQADPKASKPRAQKQTIPNKQGKQIAQQTTKKTRAKKPTQPKVQETQTTHIVLTIDENKVPQAKLKRVIAYVRVSTDTHEQDKQRHDIETYAQKENLTIDKWIEIEMSSKKAQEKHNIDKLKQELKKSDLLLVAKLTCLGRSMVEVMNLMEYFNQVGVFVCFVGQPELSTYNNALGEPIITIYNYLAKAEREMVRQRIKSALVAKKAEGQHLGREKGTFNKNHPLDPFQDTIRLYREKGLNFSAILKLLDCPRKPKLVSFLRYCKTRGLK